MVRHASRRIYPIPDSAFAPSLTTDRATQDDIPDSTLAAALTTVEVESSAEPIPATNTAPDQKLTQQLPMYVTDSLDNVIVKCVGPTRWLIRSGR